MNTYPEIWSCTEDRDRLWETDPERAARLAYLEVLASWYEQVQSGHYIGVPAVHRLPSQQVAPRVENVVKLRPKHTPDAGAAQYSVPAEILRRFGTAA